jgi:WXG100 family type VII secretion target
MGFLGDVVGGVAGAIGGLFGGGGGDGLSIDFGAIEEALGQITQQSQAIEGVQSAINAGLQPILAGAWIGNGAEAFTGEVQQTLMPAVNELISSIGGLSSLVNFALGTMKEADQAAGGIIGFFEDAVDAIGGFLGGL